MLTLLAWYVICCCCFSLTAWQSVPRRRILFNNSLPNRLSFQTSKGKPLYFNLS